MTETTIKKQRFPGWVVSTATIVAVFGLLQVPKIWRAIGAGIEGGEHICQMVYEGKSVKTAFESMADDKRFDYPLRYESIAKAMLKSELSTCPPLKPYFKARS